VAYERVNARALTTDCRLAAGGALASPLIGFEPAARRRRRRRRALRGRPRPDFKATTPHTHARARSVMDPVARLRPRLICGALSSDVTVALRTPMMHRDGVC